MKFIYRDCEGQPVKKKRKRERKGTSRWTRYRQKVDDVQKWTREAQLNYGNLGGHAIPNAVANQVGSNETPDQEVSEISNASVVDCPDGDYCVLEVDDDDEIEVEHVVSSGSYKIDKSLSLRNQLARWCVTFSIHNSAFSALLKILIAYEVVANFPCDSRTVLQTARSVKTRKVSGGEYFHFGIAESLKLILGSVSDSVFNQFDGVLDIIVNTDGLPCFKSVNTHFWPILGTLFAFGKSSKPFTIGVFYGVEKDRNVQDFLSDFVMDYNSCRTKGFDFKNRTFKVNIYAFVCDAPARAFVKNVLNFASRFPCERCKVGSENNWQNRFLRDVAEPRTDANILKLDESHNKGPSPLSACGIKLVSQFVLDYMHLVLLGVVKRLITMWIATLKRDDTHDVRLSPGIITDISNRLLTYIETCPKEFARKPRALSNFRMFKATEFRTFLLYTGMVCLKGLTRNVIYQNFLLLVCSMRIYLSDKYSARQEYRNHAKEMLQAFVGHYRRVYGLGNVVYNVHNLLHLHDDVVKYGSLDKVSSFPFENHLQIYKKRIRNGSNTLQQLIRRVDEEQRLGMQHSDMFEEPLDNLRYLHPHDFPLPGSLLRYRNEIAGQYKVVEFRGVRFSVFAADSCIRLQDSSVGKIVNIVRLTDGSCLLVYKIYRNRKSFFDYPMDSQAVGISLVDSLSDYTMTVCVKECQKAWLIPIAHDNKWVAIDLLE